MRRWLTENSLSMVLFVLYLVFLGGQSVAGFLTYNQEQEAHNSERISYVQYLGSGGS